MFRIILLKFSAATLVFILPDRWLVMASQMLVRRMKRELDSLSRGGAAPGISAWPRDEGSRLDVIDAEITGAADTPYQDGVFRLELNIPPEYPLKPPRVRFVTPIYHPNIDSQGRVCLDTLTMPPKGAWKPSLNIATLLTTVQALMSSPNVDDGLMVEITDEYRRNPALFREKARQHTLKHACPHSTEKLEQPALHGPSVKHLDDEITPAPQLHRASEATPLNNSASEHAIQSSRLGSSTRSHDALDDRNARPPQSKLGRLKKRPRLN